MKIHTSIADTYNQKNGVQVVGPAYRFNGIRNGRLRRVNLPSGGGGSCGGGKLLTIKPTAEKVIKRSTPISILCEACVRTARKENTTGW